MRTLRKQDRDQAMTVIVSYKAVPMFRGLAFALWHIDRHGGHVDIFSADRRDKIIAEHNRQFGTHLSGQQHLVDLYRAGQGNPANSPQTTSHCLRSDGNPVYRVDGQQIPATHELPWYMLGLDLSDHGQVEDVSRFLHVAAELGYHFVQPYASGSERHHVVCARSPIAVLERYNVIAKTRGSA